MGLAAFLEPLFGTDKGCRYIDITLVGHSQGGLVIQSYLVDALQDGRGREVEQIRQIIMLGTPNLGSTILSPLRRWLYWLLPNPQERLLRVLEPEIGDIRTEVTRRIVTATERLANECPIPVFTFWGQQDRIVLESSARGQFTHGAPLPGDHFGIIRPRNSPDPTYDAIADEILEPHGHPHLFEIDEYRFLIRVQPHDRTVPVLAEYGASKRVFQTDNKALIRRKARFSRKNVCRDFFTIKWATRNQGFVKPTYSHHNAATTDLQRMWEDEGTQAWFQFHPEPRVTYSLSADVYKGFDEGQRDAHHHLGRKSFYRRYVCELDLSAYLEAGYSTTGEPSLCFLLYDPEHSALCAQRNRVHADPPVTVSKGVWRWELEHLREGVVDIRWDIKDVAV